MELCLLSFKITKKTPPLHSRTGIYICHSHDHFHLNASKSKMLKNGSVIYPTFFSALSFNVYNKLSNVQLGYYKFNSFNY